MKTHLSANQSARINLEKKKKENHVFESYEYTLKLWGLQAFMAFKVSRPVV